MYENKLNLLFAEARDNRNIHGNLLSLMTENTQIQINIQIEGKHEFDKVYENLMIANVLI